MPPHGIEVVWVTPAELLGAFFTFLALIIVAVVATVWAMRGPSRPDLADDPERTVEIPGKASAGVRPRRHQRPQRTGTIHAAHLPVPDDSPTEVIRRPGVQR